MLLQKFLSLVLMAGMLAPPLSLQGAIDPTCNAAQYVSDPSVPDGASFSTGTAFTKTWRLLNAGSCTWTTSYKLVFVSGDPLGAPASVNLPVNVPPGQMADLSVNMTAPAVGGHYLGYWKLSNETGTTFGIGSSASDPFWVDINAVEVNTVIYDFVVNAPYAQWKNSSSILPYPGTSGDSRGYSFQVNNPRLEDDSVDTLPGLLVVPHNKYNGYIQATYPEFIVQKGDHFQTLVNCEFSATGCYVTFRLDYLTATGSTRSLWTWKEAYDKRFYRADIDLSPLAGQKVRFILNVLSTGFASGDRAIWGAPRIVRAGSTQPPGPAPTLTPLPPLTPTPTPFGTPPPISPAACEKAAFVADITVPDGTRFSPGAGFTKTWRLKNIGSCAWTTAYKFVYYSGSQMNAPTAINLPAIIIPGQTVDLSLNMVAPQGEGFYRGNWILQNVSGALFGIGKAADTPVWAEIHVMGEAPVEFGYDFVKNACAAEWKVPIGVSPCPGLNGDLAGFVLPLSSTQLEDGTMGPAPSILMAPQYKYNGYIQGLYPAFTVQPGDRFQSTVGCEYGTSCYVTFRLDYMTATGSISTFWSWREQNEGRYYNADVDLTPLAGRSVRFILVVSATGSPAGDRAVWGAPRIARTWVPPIITITVTSTHTPTPSPTPTPTATSTPTGTPWIAQVNNTYGFQYMIPSDAQKENGSNDNLTRIRLPFAAGTNLVEKYLDVGVAQNVTTCQSPLATSSILTGSETVTINGLTFLKQIGEDRGAGQIHEWVAYSTARGTACVSFDLVLHSANPDNYPTPPPIFDKAAESAVLQNIVQTFAWLPSSNWLTYANSKYGFLFIYPPEGQITAQEDNHARITLPFAAGTNLREKYLDLVVVENVTTCRSPVQMAPPPMGTSETVTINGLTFLKETSVEAAAGNHYNLIVYSTPQGSTCTSFVFLLHSIAAGNVDPPLPEFDMTAESAVFQDIVATFKWSPPMTPVIAVISALNSQNFDAAKARMDQTFVMAFWQSQGTAYTPDEAIEQLRLNYIGAGTHLIPDPQKDLVSLLGGFNPYAIMGLDPAKSQALYVSGWGLDGKAEALLYFVRRPDDTQYWHSVLIAPSGFATFTATGTYAVTLVAPNDVLNIRSAAGVANPIVGSFPWNATNVTRTGESKQADNATWVEVQRPDGGTGWVNFNYLTEFATRDSFCSDQRVLMTVDLLRNALSQSNGGLFASLVSPKHGIDVQFWRDGTGARYTTATAQGIFTDPTLYDWGAGPAAGPTPITGTFAQIVQPDMLGVFNSNYQLFCDDPSYASMFVNPWPHTNIHYYAVVKPPTPEIVFDWKVWLIGIEYVDGNPYLYGTVHYVWEP